MNKNIGSNFDDFLESEGILEEVNAIAIKRVFIYQIEQIMKEKELSKKELAEHLNTSRSQVNRLLDPSYTSITLSTMVKCAQLAGKELKVSFI